MFKTKRSMKASIKRLIRFIHYCALDLKYGSWYLGARPKQGGRGCASKGWHGSQSSDYAALSAIFSHVDLRADDVIVDIGCGRGRLFNFLLSQGLNNPLIGIEVDHHIANQVRERSKQYKQVSIITADVESEDLDLAMGSVFYLFNPFVERIIRVFRDKLAHQLKQGSKGAKGERPLIIYYNCRHLHLFEDDDMWTVKKLGPVSHTQLEAAIIQPAVP